MQPSESKDIWTRIRQWNSSIMAPDVVDLTADSDLGESTKSTARLTKSPSKSDSRIKTKQSLNQSTKHGLAASSEKINIASKLRLDEGSLANSKTHTNVLAKTTKPQTNGHLPTAVSHTAKATVKTDTLSMKRKREDQTGSFTDLGLIANTNLIPSTKKSVLAESSKTHQDWLSTNRDWISKKTAALNEKRSTASLKPPNSLSRTALSRPAAEAPKATAQQPLSLLLANPSKPTEESNAPMNLPNSASESTLTDSVLSYNLKRSTRPRRATRRFSDFDDSTGDSGTEHITRTSRLQSPEISRGTSVKPIDHDGKLVRRDNRKVLYYPQYSTMSTSRSLELGGLPGCVSYQQLFTRYRSDIIDSNIQPWRSWTGASKDVISLAWAPDGLSFLAGSSTEMDENSSLYNRKNNLVLGNLPRNELHELNDHHIERPKVGNHDEHPEETEVERHQRLHAQTLAAVLESKVYTTISDVCYGDTQSQHFFTASYDHTVKMWDMNEDKFPVCIRTIPHANRIDSIERCRAQSTSTILASAQQSEDNGVQIFNTGSNTHLLHHTIRTEQAPLHKLHPTAIAWGYPSAGTATWLAAGYGDQNQEATTRSRGDIVIQDLTGDTTMLELRQKFQCVYDLAWSYHRPWLAAGISANNKKGSTRIGTQSTIRMWCPSERHMCIFDIDCPALDINKVVFNPLVLNYVSASCTDSTTYHYDLRKPNQVLAKFQHGDPLIQLWPEDHGEQREKQDHGIQFISWNIAGTLLYTGASDGKVKQWNPSLHEEDALIEDVAQFDSSISSGQFSPDFTNLLIGTTKGSVHVLSSGPVLPWDEEDDLEEEEGLSFRFRPARSEVVEEE